MERERERGREGERERTRCDISSLKSTWQIYHIIPAGRYSEVQITKLSQGLPNRNSIIAKTFVQITSETRKRDARLTFRGKEFQREYKRRML